MLSPFSAARASQNYWVLGILILSCSACITDNVSQKTRSEHPVEHHLIPNVELDDAPLRYGIEERMQTHNITGFGLTIIENKEVIFSKGYGWARRAEEIPIDENTVFQAGSISKSVTALLVLLLEEQGILSLDQDVSDYLKEWQLPESKFTKEKAITLRHLLNHTSGIMPYYDRGYQQGEPIPTLLETLSGGGKIAEIRIDTFPGVRYQYSNLGFGIVQQILEETTQLPLDSLAQKLIFRPLQMSSSTFKNINPSEANQHYCYSYDYEGNPNPGYWFNQVFQASGSLKTTMQDLSLLFLAIQNAIDEVPNSYFSSEIANKIISQQGYHLGFEIEREEESLSLTHTGRTAGFFAYVRIYPFTGQGFLMFANSDNGGEIFKDVLRGLSDHYAWDILNPKKIHALNLTKSELEEYVGDYRLVLEEEEYIIEIRMEESQLIYALKGDSDRYPLQAIAKDEFVDMVDGDDLNFSREGDQITELVSNQENTFSRIN